MDKQTQLEIEAAAWRKMLGHFQKRSDVQRDLCMKSHFPSQLIIESAFF